MDRYCCGKGSGGTWSDVRCKNKPKFEHEGKSYCSVHYPPNEAERKRKLHEKWIAKTAEALNQSMSERKQSHERARKLADYERLARENAMLKAELQHGRQTIAELSEQLEFDRSLVADCLTNAKNAVKSRLWLTEGRGSYEWNDDRWREEFGAAANEFLKAIEPMEKVSRDWTGCPKTGEEIAKARIDLKAELERLTDLTQRDRIVLAEALINPPEPNDKLKDAAERLEIK